MPNENKTQPLGDETLLNRTPQNLQVCIGDTGQTIEPLDIVYLTKTAAENAVSVTDAAYGSGTGINTETKVGVVLIPDSHPSFNQAYAKTTAFTATTDSFEVHWLSKGDQHWAKRNGVASTVDTVLITYTNGLLEKPAGSTAASVYAAHKWDVLNTNSDTTYVQVRYESRGAVDNS